MLWGILIIGLVVGVTIIWIVADRRAAEQKVANDRRRRFSLRDTNERLPLAPERAPSPVLPIAEEPVISRPREQPGASVDADASATVTGRIVQTPEGEMILTTPPFALRDAIFSTRVGRFVNALTRRLPAWTIVCPRVRLDSLLTPTKPDGRDPHDWREWRRRVRVRSVDLVLCDRRTWKPLVAMVFDQRRAIDARRIAGGEDRMIDEVLRAAGLPLVRLSGEFETDWPLIAPYVDESILPHVSEEAIIDAADRTNRVNTDAAVTLLRLDQDKGWMLE